MEIGYEENIKQGKPEHWHSMDEAAPANFLRVLQCTEYSLVPEMKKDKIR